MATTLSAFGSNAVGEKIRRSAKSHPITRRSCRPSSGFSRIANYNFSSTMFASDCDLQDSAGVPGRDRNSEWPPRCIGDRSCRVLRGGASLLIRGRPFVRSRYACRSSARCCRSAGQRQRTAVRHAAEMQGIENIKAAFEERALLPLASSRPRPVRSQFAASLTNRNTGCARFQSPELGTAAEPKLIPFTHRNMLAAASRLQAWFDLTPQDRCLSVSPPFYSHGLKVTVFTPLLTGGTVLFSRKMPPNSTIRNGSPA